MLQYEPEDTSFEQAVQNIRFITVKPTDVELLKLYGLYKQTTIGNNTNPSPGLLQMKDSAKWSSWKSYSGKGKIWAKDEYVKLVNQLIKKYQSKKTQT
jgi:diazepam-binding inhibitor (GABA receptor modulating acyl-CoA-binding protein)